MQKGKSSLNTQASFELFCVFSDAPLSGHLTWPYCAPSESAPSVVWGLSSLPGRAALLFCHSHSQQLSSEKKMVQTKLGLASPHQEALGSGERVQILHFQMTLISWALLGRGCFLFLFRSKKMSLDINLRVRSLSWNGRVATELVLFFVSDVFVLIVHVKRLQLLPLTIAVKYLSIQSDVYWPCYWLNMKNFM